MESVISNLLDHCHIITASSAQEGLAKAKDNVIDTALIDVQMPEMDGIEMCQLLSSYKKTNFPVILITAHPTSFDIRSRGWVPEQ